MIIASGRQIELEDLPEAIARQASGGNAFVVHERAHALSDGKAFGIEIEMPSTIEEIERQVIEATLKYTDGDKSRAARFLNIGRKTLYRKLEIFGLDDAGGN